MTLTAGTKLGPYEVVSPLRAGGMGEVYRARDTKLNRDVALKVLPDLFAADPERLARFEREAQVLAALNHPHIAQIYGFEESGEHRALVMELVDGPTLADRIAEGALPLTEALPIARQIADALEAAHEQGIIHRDLKPANIKVRPDGTVKVLDFGLAKALDPTGTASASATMSPTISLRATRAGVILGTAAYMAPEQARGLPADKRADIWAFGCVLYELLTGRRLFDGATVSDTLAAVLRQEIDLSRLPPDTSRAVVRLLQRCLDRDARKRLRDIGDARFEIEEGLSAPSSLPTPQFDQSGRRPAMLGLTAALAGVVLGAGAVWSLRPAAAPDVGRVARLAIPLPSDTAVGGLLRAPALALSPEGDQIAYVGVRRGIRQLYLRSLDGADARPIAGTEGVSNVFFSPDGQWLGFEVDRHVKKIAVSGGATADLAVVPYAFGAAWGPNQTILFTPKFDSALWAVPAAGGVPREVTKLDAKRNEAGHHWPEWLPGGDAVLFTVVHAAGTWDDASIEVQSLSTGERRELVKGGTYGRYAASGHLLYIRAGTLMAVPFDVKQLRVTGSPVPVLENVSQSIIGAGQFSTDRHGSLAYVAGAPQSALASLVWIDRTGASQPVNVAPQPYWLPRVAPDGRRVAVWIIGGARCDVAVYDTLQETWTRLTFASDNHTPVWSPDGRWIAYQSNSGGSYQLFRKPADGSGAAEQLTRARGSDDAGGVPGSYAHDGRSLAFTRFDEKTGWDLWRLSIDGDRTPRPVLQTAANEFAPAFSPDGRWVAYVSDEVGRHNVFVRSVDAAGGKWQISNDGGSEPVWAPGGRELFYRHGDSLMAVEIATHPAFVAGKPTTLLDKLDEADAAAWTANYDVSPDGGRFLFARSSSSTTPATHIGVALNWLADLTRRVPTR